MNKFIYKLVILLLIGSLFFIFLEFVIFPNNNNQMTLKNDLLLNSIDTEILVLGNSHLLFGINPEESGFKAINIANKGRKLETDFFLLRKNIERFKSLKCVIIPISHYTLLSGELSSNEKRLYYRFYKLKEYSQNMLNNYLLFNEPFRELVNGIFFNSKEFHNNFISKFGWKAEKGIYKGDLIEAKERVKNMESNSNNRPNRIIKNLKFIDSIIQLQKKYHFGLIFISPPYHNDYYKYSNSNYHRKINTMMNLKVKNNKNIFYILGKNLGLRNDSLFKNSDHLNNKGAKIFTKKLDSIINILLMNNKNNN